MITRKTRTIEELNADPMLENVYVRWMGQTVSLYAGNKMLTVLSATPNVLDKIVRWLDKNSYRATQIHDGRIWL